MRTPTRWSVPAALAAGLLGGSLFLPQLASAEPELPPATAEELLAEVAMAEPRPFSGTVVQRTDLGLPQLPRGSHGDSPLAELLGGFTTASVWSDGPERSRLSVLVGLDETEVIRGGDDVWVWRSGDRSVTHAVVPSHERYHEPPATALTPQDAAARVLDLLDPTTAVAVDGTARVAGRDAYELVLLPRDSGTLVGEVRLAVDATTSLPLRVQVAPRGSNTPAFETRFTSIDFAVPDPGVFEFTPPDGATVTEVTPHRPGRHDGDAEPSTHKPSVVGEGWASVLVLHGASLASLTGAEDRTLQTLLDAFRPVSGDFGSGRLLGTSLLSVLALDDGRVLVGMVPPAELQDAALDPAAATPTL